MISRKTPHSRESVLVDDRPLRSLLGLLRPFRRRLVLGLGIYLVKDCPLWLIPVLTARVVDLVVAGGPISEIWIYAGIALVLLGQNYPLAMWWARLFNTTVREVASSLRRDLAWRLQVLSIGFHTRASASVVQTKVVRDVENVELMLQQSVPPLISSTFILAGAVVMTAINVPQFLAVYAVTVPLAVVLYAVVRTRSRRHNEAFRLEVERFSARVGEMATLIPITRAHGLEGVAAERVSDAAGSVRDAGVRLDLLNGRFGAATWTTMQVLSFGTIIGAAAAAITGAMPITAGEVVLLGSYFTLLTGAVTNVLGLVPVMSRGLESLRSIAEVMQDPDIEHNEGKAIVGHVQGKLALRRVGFRYPHQSRDVLQDVSLQVGAGETVAFVGASGSGKSTLLNLVLGFLRPSAGQILLDGQDMEQLDLRSYRQFVSVVPQESVLFEGTIRENLTYGLNEVPDEVVRAALRDANADSFVDAMPAELNTLVGERGARLSGGQRQRLAIARALIRDPRVLLLDEATSALDSESESLVREALHRLMANRTTLIVAHRLSTIRQADRIVVMEGGRIAEIGSHVELLDKRGRYWAMHAAQTSR